MTNPAWTPTFMRNDIPINAPGLDAGALDVGSPVVVSPPRYGRRPAEVIPAEVTAKARVWVTVTESAVDRPRSWRLRLDTQHDGSDSNYRTSFRTPEQELHHAALNEAGVYLSEQGIRLDYTSPWSKTAWDKIRLARLIWAAENGDELAEDVVSLDTCAARVAEGN